MTDRARCACKPSCTFFAELGEPYALAHDKRPEKAVMRSEEMRRRGTLGCVGLDLPSYRNRPVDLARDMFGVELWSRQSELVQAVADHDRVACRSGHKTGKSLAVAVLAWWFALSRPAGRVVITSPAGRQIRVVNWREVRRLHRIAKPAIAAEVNEHPERGAQLATGGEILGFTSDEPERFAGISGEDLLFIVDEASGIAPEIYETIMGSAAGDAKILLVGNPTRQAGPFFDAFHDSADLWHRLHISSEESPNVIAAERLIPGLATKKWLDERRADWGDGSPLYSVRVKGEWPSQAANAVIGIELVERATTGYDRAAFDTEPGKLVLGVDVARFGGDESVIFVVRGKVALPPIVRRGLDSIALANLVVQTAMTYWRDGDVPVANVDETGVGGGVVDQLRRMKGITVNAINAGESPGDPQYQRRRDELWFGIRDWLKDGGMLPNDPKLVGELVAVEYAFTPTGKIQVEGKDELRKRLGRSPDRADALALGVHKSRQPHASLTGWSELELPQRRI
jgi:hypothetical protein